MSKETETLTSPEAKNVDKNKHHVNALVYAAGASRVEGAVWGLLASTISAAAFYLGLHNKSTAKFTSKLAKYVTFPEHKIRTFISNLTKSDPPPPNTGKNATLTAAIAIGFIVNHLAQIPAFEAARRKVHKINMECDATRDENEMLKQENAMLKKLPQNAETKDNGSEQMVNSASRTSFRNSIPPKNAEGFSQGVINSQSEAKETTGPAAV